MKHNLVRVNHLTRIAFSAVQNKSNVNFKGICKAFGYSFDEYISALTECTSAKWVYQSGIKYLKH